MGRLACYTDEKLFNMANKGDSDAIAELTERGFWATQEAQEEADAYSRHIKRKMQTERCEFLNREYVLRSG